MATYGLSREWWIEHMRELYETFQAEVLARNGKARWAEKDPTYTLLLAFIEELFPTAVYVHLLRDGHDVVASFRDRWGYRSAARAARTIAELRGNGQFTHTADFHASDTLVPALDHLARVNLELEGLDATR